MGNLSNLYISRSFQSLIHLGTDSTAASTLTTLQDGYGNSIGIEVNTAGDLYLSGSLTASLQQGYLYVGNASGKTSAFATSSLVTNINTGSLVTTASFNSYTSSTNIRLNNLENTSASVNVSISNLNSTTSSFATSITNLNSATQSLQAQLATIGTQSGSWGGGGSINTGSFATTGSNTFTGNQTISLNGGEFRITNPDFPQYGTVAFGLSNASNGGIYFKNSGSIVFEGAPSDNKVTFYGTGSFTRGVQVGANEQYGDNLFIRPINGLVGAGYPSGSAIGLSMIFGKAIDNTPTRFTAVDVTIDRNLVVTGSFTSSLANGYVWVGDANNKTSLVATSSFVTTINTGSFATTGSNIFVGNQIITGSVNISGSTAVIGTLTSTFNQPNNNSQVDNLKVNSFVDKYGYTLTNNTLGWQRYEGTVEGWVQELYTGDYGYGSSVRHEASGMTWELYPSGSAYESNLVSLQGNTNGTTTFKVIADVAEITASVGISGNLTASLQQGYIWVGNGNGRTTTISTGSFVTEAETGSFAILGANQIFTGNNTFTGNTVVSQSATYGTASFYGPVQITNGIVGDVDVTGSLVATKVGAYDFDNIYYGSQMGGTTTNGTFFGYGSNSYEFVVGAYSGPNDNELKITTDANGIQFGDFNGSGYNTFLKLGPNSGANPSPAFLRGLTVTGSLETSGSLRQIGNSYISGNVYVSGSINLLNDGGNGHAFSGKALFLTNSVQTGITIESPIHFYQVGKGNMYIQNNVSGVGSGSMNIIAANGANLNISSSNLLSDGSKTTINAGDFQVGTDPTADIYNGFKVDRSTNNYAMYNLGNTSATFDFGAVDGTGFSYSTELLLTAVPSKLTFQDFSIGDYAYHDWLTIPQNTGSNPAPQFNRGLASTGSITIKSGSGDLYVHGHKQFNCGAWQDLTTQSGSANTAYAFKFNTTDVLDGVILSGSTGLQATAAGIYNIQWSGQLVQGASSAEVTVWLRKNGTNIAGTGGQVTMASNTKLLPAWNYMLELNANDVIELMWGSDSSATTWAYIPASGIYPACASIIATISQVR